MSPNFMQDYISPVFGGVEIQGSDRLVYSMGSHEIELITVALQDVSGGPIALR